ncbi:MAG: AraC family transcriptional regulator [Treponema sp.]|nr:AraC family transcriptional regulator [Treponema sp.]
MFYNFGIVPGRRIVECVPNIWINPQPHPARTMTVHDIFYMVDGYWSVSLEQENIRIRPGDIALLPAAIAHGGYESCRANTRTIFIHFSLEKTDHRVKGSGGGKNRAKYLTVSSLCHDNGSVFGLFRHLAKTFQSQAPGRELRCRALLDLLLAELADICRGEPAREDAAVGKLLEYMADRPEKFFTIAELSREAKMSGRSLTRRFRAETGKTVHQYQMDYKLDRVANLLRTRSFAGLKNLAVNFGFCDEFHLSSSFKRKFGVSPGRFGKTT